VSFIQVDADQVGHLRRVYGGAALPQGRIIAAHGENGFQADVLPPGSLKFSPFIRLTHDFQEFPLVEVPAGSYARLEASDGAPMQGDQVLADAWPESIAAQMLDAEYFLSGVEHGMNARGQRGAQTSILTPGRYPLNLYLWRAVIRTPEGETVYDRTGVHHTQKPVNATSEAQSTSVIVVPAGYVGVVKSNVTERMNSCVENRPAQTQEDVRVSLVPNGCRGVWRNPLFPGAYYMNRDAYEVRLVDTRVSQWEYKGGYTARRINLTVDQRGEILQTSTSEQIAQPRESADSAVFVRVEGWDIPQELRVLVQVRPENAAAVVASLGGLQEIEDRIITPMIRSVVRNVVGSEIVVNGERRATKALDLIDQREAIENTIEQIVRVESSRAGVDIMQLRFGESVIPPELLVARRREQLAQQLRQAYQQETIAQTERAKTEAARAEANQQDQLVAARIAVQVAHQRIQERTSLGEAEKAFLELLAAGQRAQSDVLGRENAMALEALKQVLTTLREKPELASLLTRLVPQTLVMNSGTGSASAGAGLEGAAAILGGALGMGGPVAGQGARSTR
jgi:hypothetical protein